MIYAQMTKENQRSVLGKICRHIKEKVSTRENSEQIVKSENISVDTSGMKCQHIWIVFYLELKC